ncbi:MAG: GNAT family N-acetyltransferase [Kiritimatiellia bacterium]
MITIRTETSDDVSAIDDLLDLAFAFDAHSRQNEAAIVRKLRESDALLLSLLAVDDQAECVGYIAFSPVTIQDGSPGGISDWVGLGPMAVNPRLQRRGIGRELIQAGLAEITARRAAGCVVLGEPGFYERFGFKTMENLILPGALAPFFLARSFNSPAPSGQVEYHPAFRI